MRTKYSELKSFFILWLTQGLSALGSSMTGFALVIWLYQQSGSALSTAMLTVSTYVPYVLMSIFAGALSDRWDKKKTMLVCDSFAALSTVVIFILMKTAALEVWHLYLLNALNGLMNTVQQPTSEVAITLITPKEYYQKTSGLRSLSGSLVSILTPVFATALVTVLGIEAVILFDLLTFAAAFLSLMLFIKIPKVKQENENEKGIFASVKAAFSYLNQDKGVLWLILFLAAINLIASIYEAAIPPMMLSRENGGKAVLGIFNTCVGVATLVGSLLATALPKPKSRVKVICNTLLFSMSFENFLLAFGRHPVVWCIGAVLGWIFIPLMGANLNVVYRTRIPVAMQGRVYAVRNTLQFFTIPLGYLIGGALVDKVFEPFMAGVSGDSVFALLFGTGRGAGAAFLFGVIGCAGIAVCLIFRRIRHIRELHM